MRTTILTALITLIGFNAQSALIEGHFYPNTCGDNEFAAKQVPSHKRILLRKNETVVEKVCHGKVLRNGAFIETLRLYTLGNQAEVIDFDVTAKFVEDTDNRSLLRKTIILAQNAELGEVEFAAITVLKQDDVLSIQSQGEMHNSLLIFQVFDMEKMMNITSVQPQILE
ncbi:MAG: hypothetical protein ACK5WZ_11730 [Pseudobdellovibrionaceae bacterium]